MRYADDAYCELGLFSEEPTGEDDGKPIYRYSLTPFGQQHFHRQSSTDGFVLVELLCRALKIHMRICLLMTMK